MNKLTIAAFAFAATATASSCSSDTSKDDADGGPSETGGSSTGTGGRGPAPDGSSTGAAGGSSGGGGSLEDGPSSGTGSRSSAGGSSPVDGGGSTDALPTSTFLYVKAQTADHDILIARDLATGEERIVTDLTGDDSDGWEIWGASISPDRKRIAIASLFGPTKADNDTGIATRRIWTLRPDGSDFQRLTPVFENTGAGRQNFSIEVDRPAFSRDGTEILFNFGNYWYEGTTLEGGSLPWSVSTAGDELPKLFPTISSCSVLHPTVNPKTGEVLLIHSVCIDRANEGLFLYPRNGGTEPTMLVQARQGPAQIDPSLTPPSWVSDGSGFVFVALASIERNGTETVQSLFLYDTTENQVAPLVIPEPEEWVQAAAVAPDASAIVYCLRHGADAHDLRLVDLTTDPATDSPLTTDGKSCYPTF